MIKVETLSLIVGAMYLVLCVVNFWTLPLGRKHRGVALIVLLACAMLGTTGLPLLISAAYPSMNKHAVLMFICTNLPWGTSLFSSLLWGRNMEKG